MRRLAAAAIFVGLLGILIAPPAWAHARTKTFTVKDQTQSFRTPNPCTGAPGRVTITFNAVMHVTKLDSGAFHETDTATGTFAFVPKDPSQPSFAGHFMNWEGVNVNSMSVAYTATFMVVGKGSDGSTLKFHEVEHLTVNSTGMKLHFDKPTCA